MMKVVETQVLDVRFLYGVVPTIIGEFLTNRLVLLSEVKPWMFMTADSTH